MKTLLMAIDPLSNPSRSLTRLTLEEASARDASVVILCCIPIEGSVGGEVMNIDCAIDESLQQATSPQDSLNCAESAVRTALIPFQQAGISARGLLCRGEPADTIVEQSLKLSASMIIMGRRHLTPFNRLFKGSVSAAVLETASCPVLIDIDKE